MQQPELVRPFKNEGDNVSIRGCQVISCFNLTNSEIYWLKDGVQKIILNVTSVSNGYLMENLQFTKSSYQNQGFYQCAVFSRGYMKSPILSERIHIQFAGKKLPTFNAFFNHIFKFFVTVIVNIFWCMFFIVKLWI